MRAGNKLTVAAVVKGVGREEGGRVVKGGGTGKEGGRVGSVHFRYWEILFVTMCGGWRL